MRKFSKILLIFFAVLMSGFIVSCNGKPKNPNSPNVNLNFIIYPNSIEFQELNTVGGWMYVTAPLPSYGVIIYRYNIDEFRAYERLSPNDPYACPDNRLFVALPFVIDSCLDNKYSILDGNIIEGTGYPLIQYFTQYDGTSLRVYN